MTNCIPILTAASLLYPLALLVNAAEPSGSPSQARQLHLRGFAEFRAGRFEAAATHFATAAGMWFTLGSGFSAAHAASLDMLGESYAASEQWNEAAAAYIDSVNAAGPASVEGAAAQSRLAYVYARLGQTTKAQETGFAALSRLPAGRLERPMLMHVLAYVDSSNARLWLSRAVSEMHAYGLADPVLALVLEQYAAILINGGEGARAQPLLRRARRMYGPHAEHRSRVQKTLDILETADKRRYEVDLARLSR